MDWKSSINGLLNKAASTSSAEEADAYRAKAEYLMTKYGIEESMLRQQNHPEEKPQSKIFKMFAPYAQRKSDLLHRICIRLNCYMVMSHDGSRATVFGYSNDIERVTMLYFSLLAQMHIECAAVKVPPGVPAKTFRNSWLYGFVIGVTKRLDAASKKAKDETPGTDLVLKNDMRKIQDLVINTFPALTKVREKQMKLSDLAFNDGRAAGQRADIGQSRVGTIRNALRS